MAKVAPAEVRHLAEPPPTEDALSANGDACEKGGAKFNRILLPPIKPTANNFDEGATSESAVARGADGGAADGVEVGDDKLPSFPAGEDLKMLQDVTSEQGALPIEHERKPEEKVKHVARPSARHIGNAAEYEALLKTIGSSKQAKLLSVQSVLFAFTFMMSTFETASR